MDNTVNGAGVEIVPDHAEQPKTKTQAKSAPKANDVSHPLQVGQCVNDAA